jgi:hypothetical protein
MKSKLLVFLALSTLMVGCGDKGSDKPNHGDAQIGELDNVNPYEVPRNAMSFEDSQDLWLRARRAEKVIPAGEAYLNQYPDSGRFNSVTSQDRRNAQQRLNNEGRRFADMMSRNCEVNQQGQDRNRLSQSVDGNRCPINSQYQADIARDNSRYTSTITNRYNFTQGLAQASGVSSISSRNFLKRDQYNQGRRDDRRGDRRNDDRARSSTTYGSADATVQYTDGERISITTKYEFGSRGSSSKMVTVVQSRRGVLRIVIIEGRGTNQATINGQTVDYNKALMGYMPRLSVQN